MYWSPPLQSAFTLQQHYVWAFTKHYGVLQSKDGCFPLLCGPPSATKPRWLWSLAALFRIKQGAKPLIKKMKLLPGCSRGTQTAVLASASPSLIVLMMLSHLEEGVSAGREEASANLIGWTFLQVDKQSSQSSSWHHSRGDLETQESNDGGENERERERERERDTRQQTK